MANQKKTITEPRREIPVRAEVDVLVVGGGPAGIMAARAAAGKGLRVMLIESRGYLGGNLTIGLPILGYLGRKGNQIIKGLPQLFIDRLRARGAAGEHRPGEAALFIARDPALEPVDGALVRIRLVLGRRGEQVNVAECVVRREKGVDTAAVI